MFGYHFNGSFNVGINNGFNCSKSTALGDDVKSEPAFPMYSEIGNLHAEGLTKREYFAIHAPVPGERLTDVDCEQLGYPKLPNVSHKKLWQEWWFKVEAIQRVRWADALIAELEKQ